MMPFLFRHGSARFTKSSAESEIRERERLGQVMFVHHLPAGELRLHFLQFLALERRNASRQGTQCFSASPIVTLL